MPENLQLSYESIAAYVMPNHPAIGQLLTTAHEIIGRRTGSPSLQGYQSDTADLGAGQRSDEIAEAIYDAMSEQGINYINPPASWDADGQKVRTPQQVLEGKQGTCLDTAVVMAAAFEQSGLAACVVIVQGHAGQGDELAGRGTHLANHLAGRSANHRRPLGHRGAPGRESRSAAAGVNARSHRRSDG